mmetsp:Transcript_26948/g.67120  ORF Transcript_26948/g.67120 Transcript_26948/m.67120 type:complete len:122 (-) Transcript_26948:43-408(-)
MPTPLPLMRMHHIRGHHPHCLTEPLWRAQQCSIISISSSSSVRRPLMVWPLAILCISSTNTHTDSHRISRGGGDLSCNVMCALTNEDNSQPKRLIEQRAACVSSGLLWSLQSMGKAFPLRQ